jgi:hypothetical protein
MAQYFAPNLLSEIVPPIDPRREKQRLEQTRQLETVVKDDDMWKELQQELAKAKVVSRAGVQEITRRFLERRESDIVAQAKIQSLANKRSKSPRRSSYDDGYSRRSSLNYIAATGKNMRRAFSVGVGLGEKEATPKGNNMSQTFFSRMNASMNSFCSETSSTVPVQARLFPAASRSRNCDDVFDVIDQASSDVEKFSDHGDRSMSSMFSCQITKEETPSTTLETDLEGDHYQSCDDSDDELLVCFPSQPRHQWNDAVKQTSVVNVARTA